jgi:hypothetical protein
MTSKRKNIVLVSSFAILLLLCYKLAIAKTLQLKTNYDKLLQEEALFKNTPKQLSIVKQKQIYYDSILNKYQISGNSIQNNLLETLTSFSNTNQLKVVNFTKPHIIAKKDITIKTYQFTIEGNYNNLLKLIHHLEQRTKYGEIINLHFDKKIDFRKNKNYLQAHVLLKSFG